MKPLLEQTFASRRAFRDRLIQWSHDHASDTGVGFFGIKLDAWRLSAKSKGHQGYLRCSVPGCAWHVKIEETQVGSSEAVAAYDAQLAHTQGVPHLPVEAPKVEVATAPGFKVFPPEYKDLALLLHRSGCPPSAILKLLNTKAREEGVTQSWDYRSVYALVAKAGVAREDDASNLLEWLQERLTSSGLGYSLHLDAGGHLERVFFEMRGVMTWKARGFHLVLYDTTHKTNGYRMKLGMFCSMDGEGHTIVLAVSLLKFEDAVSFAWAFDTFAETVRSHDEEKWAPSVMFTDSDPAMAAGIKHVFGDETAHLLCVYHIAQNLQDHLAQLFPLKKDLGAKRRFANAFHNLLNRYGTETDVDRFDERWLEMCKIAHAVTPCPWGLPDEIADAPEEIDVDDANACARELELAIVDADQARSLVFSREEDRAKRSAAYLGWKWLHAMHRRRKQWARCFMLQNFTAQIFSTQRSESAHASLKQWLSSTFTLCDLCKQIEDKFESKQYTDAVKSERIRGRQTKDDDAHDILKGVRKTLTARGFEILRGLVESSGQFAVSESASKEDTWTLAAEAGADAEEAGLVDVTLEGCECQAPVNTGLPCVHQLAVLIRTNRKSIPDGLIANLWRRQSDAERDLTLELEMAEKGLAKGKVGKQLEAAAERMSNAQVSSAMFAGVKPMIELAQANSGVTVEALAILHRAYQELEDLCAKRRNAMGKRRRASGGNAPALVSVGDTEIEVLNPVAPVSGAGRTREKRYISSRRGGGRRG